MQAQAVTDIDGNVYDTVIVGTQIWMGENLKVTHYRNGDPIPNVTSNAAWSELTTGAMCFYANDSVSFAPVYGALYNGYAAVDSRKLCPTGWHVASDSDWNILEIYLDPTVDTTLLGWTGSVIGIYLKELGFEHWFPNQIMGTDIVGFTALPGGVRSSQGGGFGSEGTAGDWWTSTPDGLDGGYIRILAYDYEQIHRTLRNNVNGYSVRCVADFQATSTNEDFNAQNIQVFPNPATNIVSIRFPTKQHFEIQIFNSAGQCVLSKELNSDSNDINISALPNGFYIIKISDVNWSIQRGLAKG